MGQLIARVPEELIAELDRLVDDGLYETRSDAVRDAIFRLVDRRRRDEIGRQIAEAYERMPQTDDEFDWSDVDYLRTDGADRKKKRGGRSRSR